MMNANGYSVAREYVDEAEYLEQCHPGVVSSPLSHMY